MRVRIENVKGSNSNPTRDFHITTSSRPQLIWIIKGGKCHGTHPEWEKRRGKRKEWVEKKIVNQNANWKEDIGKKNNGRKEGISRMEKSPPKSKVVGALKEVGERAIKGNREISRKEWHRRIPFPSFQEGELKKAEGGEDGVREEK